MSDGIRLHPEKGVNARLTYCPRCGKEAQELMLVGAADRVVTCSECGAQNYGGLNKGRCGVCGERSTSDNVRTLRDGEKLPASDICDACKKEVKEMEEIVGAGGLYFFCEECGQQGVIKESAPLCRLARERQGPEYAAPIDGQYKAMGIKFQSCEEHGGERKGEDDE